MTMVLASLLSAAMKPSSLWHLKSSSTRMHGRCWTMLPLLGRSFQLPEIHPLDSRWSLQLFSCTPKDMPSAGWPCLARFAGWISHATEFFRGRVLLPLPLTVGGMNGALKMMRGETFLPSAMTARTSLKPRPHLLC
ncbi:unnamed protein product [Ectocarpus sp. CCAP 1310/34]|nr:unnamed protein product [Ectocarpus sp. CCAP 1310/34]